MRICSANAHVFKLKRKSSSRHNDINAPCPERSEGNQPQLPPLNPEARGMSGPESPLQRRPALRLGCYQIFSKKVSSVVFPIFPLMRSPAGSVPVMPRETSEKCSSFCGIVFYAALYLLRNRYSQRVLLYTVIYFIVSYTKHAKYIFICLILSNFSIDKCTTKYSISKPLHNPTSPYLKPCLTTNHPSPLTLFFLKHLPYFTSPLH